MPTKNELKILQGYDLDLKIAKTQQRIREWVNEFGVDGVYVSFSGGKDSTVLLDIVRKMYGNDIEAVFVDTGLEYPEIRQFVKSFDNVTILRPKMRFDEVIRKYGYPLISKEVAECISQAKIARENRKYVRRLAQLEGTLTDKYGNKSIFNHEKYKPLLDVDFAISNKCCNVMKKQPVHEHSKKTGKVSITAQMADESKLRLQKWLQNGCNAFNAKNPISNPMSFWTEQDVLLYIKRNSLQIASVYGDIVYGEGYDNLICDCGSKLCTTGCNRTGCVYCAFGTHLTPKNEESRFQRLKRTHPRQYDYCLNGGAYDTDGLWKPTKDGLGMKHCFDVLNELYSKNGKKFIEY